MTPEPMTLLAPTTQPVVVFTKSNRITMTPSF